MITIDLADGYHQFLIRKEDRVKTAFTVDGEQWMFRVCPFGIKTVPAFFQRVMEKLVADLGVQPYLDDIAVASKKAEQHVKIVLQVLT